MSTKDVLINARALVADGWTQGQARAIDPTGKVSRCMAAALMEVAGSISVFDRAYRSLKDAACDVHTELEFWNDMRGRTKAQVLAAFDRAIANQSR